jgi:hypothetical protein
MLQQCVQALFAKYGLAISVIFQTPLENRFGSCKRFVVSRCYSIMAHAHLSDI